MSPARISSSRSTARWQASKVGQIVMEGHIHHCVKDGIEHGDAEKTIAEFTKVIQQFSKI